MGENKLITNLDQKPNQYTPPASRQKKGQYLDESHYEPYPKEKVIIKYKKPREGLGCGCRGLTCGGCLIILLILVGFIYLIIAKPLGLWNFTVSFLNDNIQVQANQNTQDINKVKDDLNSQIQTIGDTDIIITQDQLTALSKEKFSNFKNLTTEITPDYIRLYWDIDQTIPQNPLKGVIEIKLDDTNKLYLNKVGTGRIGLPAFLNNFITNTFYSILNINNSNKDDKYGFLTNLIPNTNMKINKIVLDNGLLHIKATVKVNLFNQ